jgi:hypothetical protein
VKVGRKTLLDVLVWDSHARLVVPGWQRPYVWEETEVLRMWSDWCTDCARDERHFCGTLILRQMPDSTANWELVDGQQRLVTFFTAFLAIRDVCRAREIDFSELGDAFTLPGAHECRLVLHEGETQDRQVLNALLTRSLDRIERKILEASRVHGAYRIFRQKMEDISSDEIPPFIVKVLQNLDLVILTVNQEDDAQRLLEGIGKRAANHGSPVDYISGFSRCDDLGIFLESLERRNDGERKVEAVLDEVKSGVAAAQRQTRVREWLRRFRKAARASADILRPREGEKSVQKETADSQRLPVSERDFFFRVLLETFQQRPDSQPLIRELVAAIVRLSITLERPRYRSSQGNGKHLASGEGNGVREASLDHLMALVDEFAVGETAFQKNSSASNSSRSNCPPVLCGLTWKN